MPQTRSLSFRRNPWVYFFLFLATNGLVSYAPLPLEAKFAFLLLGVVLPLYVAFRTGPPPSPHEKPGYLTDFKWAVPLWLWTVVFLVLVFLRFYKLETLFRWPNLDEGWIGTLAIQLSRHWSWKFFYTFGEAPPLTLWTVAGLFKLGSSPAFSLWFPPAVVSVLTVPAAYFAARQFFSKSFALVCGALTGFSYWPLLIGRLCHQGIWLPLWVCLGLYLLGGFQKARDEADKAKWALGLGVGTGLGSFIFTPWPLVAGLLWMGLLWHWSMRSKINRRYFLLFSLSLAFTLLPFFLAVWREGYGTHILSLTPWGGWFHGFDFFTNFFRYFAVLLWDSFERNPAYTPVWGGFLNPLLGSFFLVGLIEMFRLRRLKLVRWVAAAFILFLFPGALSPNLETFRVAQVLPLLLFITALGIQTVAGMLPHSKRLWILAGLLALTGAFDFNLLAEPYRNPDAHPKNFGRPLKSLDRYRAFGLLGKSKADLVLADYDTDSYNDPTLSVMTYPLNAARGGGQPPPARIGLFVNIHYKPFLQKRFPRGEFYDVSAGLDQENGGNLLVILGKPEAGKAFPGNWVTAHSIFQAADLNRFEQTDGSMEKSIATLDAGYPLLEGDPFLESVYWDKRAAYEYEELNYAEQLRSYQMALARGYPTAELYYKLGQLFLVKRHYPEAREAFLKATRAPLDLTQAQAALEWLRAQAPAPHQNNSR